MTTLTQARDAIFDLVNDALAASGTTSSVALLWDNVKGAKPGEGTNGNALPWIRLALRHNLGEQDTMGRLGARRYLAGGTFTAQIFTPFGDGHTQGYAIAEVVKAALRAASPHSTVWFFDIVVSEIGEDGPWFNINVDATFRYQERA